MANLLNETVFPFLSRLPSRSSQYSIVNASLANSMTIWYGLKGPFLSTNGNLWILLEVRLLSQLTVSGEPKNCILIFVFSLWLQPTNISIQLTHYLTLNQRPRLETAVMLMIPSSWLNPHNKTWIICIYIYSLKLSKDIVINWKLFATEN